jgi:hypothetical protein
LSFASTLKSIVKSRAGLVGLGIGVAYGLAARVVIAVTHDNSNGFAVMTIGFLFVVPLVIGYLTILPMHEPSLKMSILAPWLTCLLVVLGSLVGGFEGAICIVLATPVMLVLSSLGGILAGAQVGRARGTLPVFLVLPWAVMGIESHTTVPVKLVTTTTSIEIAASPSTIWPLVVSVDSIRPSERRQALFASIGFPQPIAATLDHPGIGGMRTASFERGVVFREVITDWIPEKRIRFTIDASTVPSKALDEHVRIGGPYFDVLTGTYELRPLSASRTLLVLTSEHRVSTRFNPYASWWANRIMSSIQSNILYVLRARAERAQQSPRISESSRMASDTISLDSCARLDRESRPMNAVHEPYEDIPKPHPGSWKSVKRIVRDGFSLEVPMVATFGAAGSEGAYAITGFPGCRYYCDITVSLESVAPTMTLDQYVAKRRLVDTTTNPDAADWIPGPPREISVHGERGLLMEIPCGDCTGGEIVTLHDAKIMSINYTLDDREGQQPGLECRLTRVATTFEWLPSRRLEHVPSRTER